VSRMNEIRVEAGVLRLTLAPSDYKTFLVTSVRDHAWFAEHAPEAVDRFTVLLAQEAQETAAAEFFPGA